MGGEWKSETVFDVLGSEEARHILALADVRPMSAEELADHLEASRPTVYRRVNACQEYDLPAEDVRIDEDGTTTSASGRIWNVSAWRSTTGGST